MSTPKNVSLFIGLYEYATGYVVSGDALFPIRGWTGDGELAAMNGKHVEIIMREVFPAEMVDLGDDPDGDGDVW